MGRLWGNGGYGCRGDAGWGNARRVVLRTRTEMAETVLLIEDASEFLLGSDGTVTDR